jgi:hypothetical protein
MHVHAYVYVCMYVRGGKRGGTERRQGEGGRKREGKKEGKRTEDRRTTTGQ